MRPSMKHLLLSSVASLSLFLVSNHCFAQKAETPSSRRSAIVQVVERSKLSVVNIQSERNSQSPFGDRGFGSTSGRSSGMGTGVIVDSRGYIVTNFHVVDDVVKLRAELQDGSSFDARVILKDKESDLALIKIDANRTLPTMAIGTSSDLMVGETVIAIGNAFGYTHTVSTGIISALGRNVSHNKEVTYKSSIQTNAAINPGNSGGPLLNIDGELIGINVAIRAGAQNISFAIPIDNVLETLGDLMARRRQGSVPLGCICRSQVHPGQSPMRTLHVDKVQPDSIAARAGLQPGDEIVQIGSMNVTSPLDLERALLDAQQGDRLPVVFKRNANSSETLLTFENLPTGDFNWRRLGVKLAKTDAETIKKMFKNFRGGMLINEVRASSPAAQAGLLPGDILVGINDFETLFTEHVEHILKMEKFVGQSQVGYKLIRDGKIIEGAMLQQ